MTDSCATCRHYWQTTSVCRRYPPTRDYEFPKVPSNAWCGEWRGTPKAERDKENETWEKLGEPIPDRIKYSGLEDE